MTAALLCSARGCLRSSLMLWLARLPVAAFVPKQRLSWSINTGHYHQARPFSSSSSSSISSSPNAAAACFDFSSVSEWEAYYAANENDAVEEWHSSVPLDVIVDHMCLGNSGKSVARILMVGCGISRLPETVWQRAANTDVTLFDSSPTCMEHLNKRYSSSARYVCGDALQLSKLLTGSDGDSSHYDVLVDKGLMDALLCGEGWNGPVQQLMQEAATVLRPGSGRYLLVSYRLPASTQDFLASIGRDVGLRWEFDCKGSNDRVGISIATNKHA